MTEDAITFEVRGAPVAKGRARIGRMANGRPIAFTPAATRKFEAVVRLNAQQAMAERAPLDGPLSVSVLAVLPIPQSWSKKKQEAARSGEVRPTSRPDVDNYAKAAIDACNEVVFHDDAQVVDLSVRKVYGNVPLLRVVVEGIRAPLLNPLLGEKCGGAP